MIEFYTIRIYLLFYFFIVEFSLFLSYKIVYGETLQFSYILYVRLDYYVLSDNTNETVVIIVIGYFGTDLVLDAV